MLENFQCTCRVVQKYLEFCIKSCNNCFHYTQQFVSEYYLPQYALVFISSKRILDFGHFLWNHFSCFMYSITCSLYIICCTKYFKRY